MATQVKTQEDYDREFATMTANFEKNFQQYRPGMLTPGQNPAVVATGAQTLAKTSASFTADQLKALKKVKGRSGNAFTNAVRGGAKGWMFGGLTGAGGGAAVGAVLGTMALPVVGTVAGAAVGGLVGGGFGAMAGEVVGGIRGALTGKKRREKANMRELEQLAALTNPAPKKRTLGGTLRPGQGRKMQ